MSEIDDQERWNEEYEDELDIKDLISLVVFSRDWTVETIFSQITKGNIDLAPDFQRRNAWNDIKRSKLIESLATNLPVPEVVLAEDINKKGSFIVIDGKQRLLAIAGFLKPDEHKSWNTPKLRSLKIRDDLNGKTFTDFENDKGLEADYRQLMNSDIRCTVLANYKTDQVLYDVFHRLNSGSVPLNSQELRQVLNRGDFTKFIMTETGVDIPLHSVMNLGGPDYRLRDSEILLRFISFYIFGEQYKGSLSNFLEESLKTGNQNWDRYQKEFIDTTEKFNAATTLLTKVLPDGKVGRKYSNGKWESRFNRVLFEVECYYFSMIDPGKAIALKDNFVEEFKNTLGADGDFLDSIESTTKTADKYITRFTLFQKLVNDVFNLNIDSIPVKRIKKNG